MKKLAGNNILLVDSDIEYVRKIQSSVEKNGGNFFHACNVEEAQNVCNNQDIELVICSYYLSDGMIHQLIDWCREYVEVLPLFVSQGQPFNEEYIMRHRLITEDWSKSYKIDDAISRMATYLKGQEELKQSLLDLAEPKGFIAELIHGQKSMQVRPTEIIPGGLFFSAEEFPEDNKIGTIKISLYDGKEFLFFSAMGYFSERDEQTVFFKIHPGYIKTWDRLIGELNNKQVQVSRFLSKVAGY